jgi:ABC-2 type transport system ATP-binding protein
MMHDPSTEPPLLHFDHVSLMYGTVMGVNDLHLDLPRGAYALVGPNGAGKSTLISLITGALRPTLGRLEVFGNDPRHSASTLQRIGLCPATDLLVHGVSAKQFIQLQLRLSGWSKSAAASRVDEVLELVGLTSSQHRPIHTYSLGMRQRCKLAQAIAHDPELLILDEPFNGLDPVGRFQMSELLIDWAQRGKSLLLASHVLHEVERITNSFLLIFGGRLLASGTAGELRRLLADLPQDVCLDSPDRDMLASKLGEQVWVRAVHRDPLPRRLVVTVEKPLELYAKLAEWSSDGSVHIERVTGTDGDISSLFRLLVSKHRGERAYQTAGASS